MRHHALIDLLTCFTLSTDVFAQDTNFWIFLCFGQSNMEGFPGIEERDMSGVGQHCALDFGQRRDSTEVGALAPGKTWGLLRDEETINNPPVRESWLHFGRLR